MPSKPHTGRKMSISIRAFMAPIAIRSDAQTTTSLFFAYFSATFLAVSSLKSPCLTIMVRSKSFTRRFMPFNLCSVT